MKELSILILTLPTRIDSYARLIKSLNIQVIQNYKINFIQLINYKVFIDNIIMIFINS